MNGSQHARAHELALRCRGIFVRPFNGVPFERDLDIEILKYRTLHRCGQSPLPPHHTPLPPHHTATSPHSTVTSPYCHVTILHCHITSLHYHLTILHCHITTLQCHPTILHTPLCPLSDQRAPASHHNLCASLLMLSAFSGIAVRWKLLAVTRITESSSLPQSCRLLAHTCLNHARSLSYRSHRHCLALTFQRSLSFVHLTGPSDSCGLAHTHAHRLTVALTVGREWLDRSER